MTVVLQSSQEQFNKTLTTGLKHFKKKADKLQEAGINEIPGEEAFFLSGSLGFPLDLTEIMAEQRGMTGATFQASYP